MFSFPSCIPTLVCQLVAKLQMCICVYLCILLLWSIKHVISGCQEKQTPVPRPLLGSSQSDVIPKSRGFVASVLFYLKVSHSYILRGRAECHELINEVMLLSIPTHAFLRAARAQEC